VISPRLFQLVKEATVIFRLAYRDFLTAVVICSEIQKILAKCIAKFFQKIAEIVRTSLKTADFEKSCLFRDRRFGHVIAKSAVLMWACGIICGSVCVCVGGWVYVCWIAVLSLSQVSHSRRDVTGIVPSHVVGARTSLRRPALRSFSFVAGTCRCSADLFVVLNTFFSSVRIFPRS